MRYRDAEVARMSAELAALKMSHEKLADIARAIVQLDADGDDVAVSEGIRPIACDARSALKQFREVFALIGDTEQQ